MSYNLGGKVRHYRSRAAAMLFQRRFSLPPELREDFRLSEALSSFRQRWPDAFHDGDETDSPVFLFSAGWRSGSTLLQRLVISSGEVVMWGEPLGEAAPVARLGQTMAAFSADWPPDSAFVEEHDLSDISNQWIANLTPQCAYLRSAHKQYLRSWLSIPAKAAFGIDRWGLKEVRLSVHHAKYLQWLFPKSRFLFIYRNLFDAYRSWKGNTWISIWPGYYSRAPVAFARHWAHLLRGFLDEHRDVDGMLICYEDLVAGRVAVGDIARHIGVKEVDAAILEKKIGAPRTAGKQKKPLTVYDRFVLSLTGRRLLKKLGYL